MGYTVEEETKKKDRPKSNKRMEKDADPYIAMRL